MADSLTSKLEAKFTWNFSSPIDLSTIRDSSTLSYAKDFATGTATQTADRTWSDTDTSLAAAGTRNLDLTALTNTIFGSTVTISFAKIRGILLINNATTSGEEIKLGASGGNEWIAMFGATGDFIRIPADSCFMATNRVTGWTVTDGATDLLRITNGGAATSNYSIVIIGTSA